MDNFQLKLHNDSIVSVCVHRYLLFFQLHSCRNLHTISCDLVLNALLHSPERHLDKRIAAETEVANALAKHRQDIAAFENVLYPKAGSADKVKEPKPEN
ncbi:uncharacterized protein BXIN_0839 [Babesia sp. Xinjiang]|uniref:uncharacterized protein n=1 Tax=Babesia sp. Xinjiang TaxID=462227 RepID=UPI000A23012C|nr:uncharacterized protein BXIN_0839 [Babesia sp. Xinjiang]ORM41297.1 hypothetical protein BXIN_0839 [Babesia sp. Xinjiang]